MKPTQHLALTLFLISTLFIPNLSAEDYNQWQLSEGARFRLGKGNLHDIKYTPDGNRIAVANGYRHLDIRRADRKRTHPPDRDTHVGLPH